MPMEMFRWRSVWFFPLAALLLSAATLRAQTAVDDRVFRGLDGPLASSARVIIEPITLDDGSAVTLEVSPVEVFAKGAEIVLHGEGGDLRIAPPSDRWFVGRIREDPSSLAVLARGASVRGFIVLEDRVAAISAEQGPYGDSPGGRTLVTTFSRERNVPDSMRTFHCGSDELPIPVPMTQGLSSPQSADSSVMYYAGIAVETDHELYAKFGSATGLSKYVGDLFAAASAVYQRDVLVTLQVNYLSIWTTTSDPWAATSLSPALSEFTNYWNSNRTAVPRVVAHMLAGRSLGGGIAYLSQLCSYFGYGVSGSLSGVAPVNITTTYWDFLVVTHELGHNFGSPHTHCYSPPVDRCYSGEGGCYVGPTSVPPEKGTIMSYCHTLSGGYSNIKMYLGVPGEPSAPVATTIRSYVEGVASCLGVVPGPAVTSVLPTSGPASGGTPVTISGSGFLSGASVKIGGTAATSVTVVNSTTITATTPAHLAGAADVTVNNPGSQGATLAGGFGYLVVVSSIDPASGPMAGGTPVMISGAGFQTGAGVTTGGVAATGVTVVSANTITATTGPHAAGIVDVVVTNPDTTSGTLPNGFSFAPPPAATSFYTVTPCRVVDTRAGSGFSAGYGPPSMAGNGAQRTFVLLGQCEIPAEAKVVSLNVTVWGPSTRGDLRIFPAGGGTASASTLNWEANILALANAAFVQVGTGGAIVVQVDGPGTVDVFLDVNGYFQ